VSALGSAFRRLGPRVRRHPWWLALAVLLLGAVALLDVWIDEPVRRFLEKGANARLEGYQVRLPRADLKPWNLALHLGGLEFRQQAHPEPPVALFPHATFRVAWSALLRGRIVADLVAYRPAVHVDTAQLETENQDATRFEDRGWQRLLELYPLKVNSLRIVDGTLAYRDAASGRDLGLSRIQLQAGNIRHVSGRDEAYPSPLQFQARLFEDGAVSLAGHADFLRRPHLAVYGVLEASGVPLAALGPVADDYRIRLTGGELAARGQVELAPETYVANMQYVDIRGLRIDVSAGDPTPDTRRAREVVTAAADTAGDSPAVRLRMQTLRIRGEAGYVSSTEPRYRLYLADAELTARNLSNRAAQGESSLAASGSFMGSGAARVRGVWRPGASQPDFALDVRVVDTELTALNDLLRAHGRLDVGDGTLSLYSQVHARDGQLRGYLKPLFSDVDVLTEEDKGDNVFQKLYEMVAEQVAKLLENRPRDEVATVAELSGDLSDPDVSGWQVFINLLRNAFVDAILPGFDRERDAGKG